MITARISNFNSLQAEIDRLVAKVPQAAATEGAQIIRDNSKEGIDIKGQKMIPYSDEYKKWRAKHGLSTEPVDLRSSGHLLDNLKTSTQGMKSSVRPSSVDTLIAEGIMNHRKFFPEIDADIMPEFEKRIVMAGEKVFDERK